MNNNEEIVTESVYPWNFCLDRGSWKVMHYSFLGLEPVTRTVAVFRDEEPARQYMKTYVELAREQGKHEQYEQWPRGVVELINYEIVDDDGLYRKRLVFAETVYLFRKKSPSVTSSAPTVMASSTPES